MIWGWSLSSAKTGADGRVYPECFTVLAIAHGHLAEWILVPHAGDAHNNTPSRGVYLPGALACYDKFYTLRAYNVRKAGDVELLNPTREKAQVDHQTAKYDKQDINLTLFANLASGR
jgi:hypothetical protein